MKNQNETELLRLQKEHEIADNDPVFLLLKAQCEAISRLENIVKNINIHAKLDSHIAKKVELHLEYLKQYKIEIDLEGISEIERTQARHKVLAQNVQDELKKSRDFLSNNHDLLADFRSSLKTLKSKTEEIAGDRVMVLVAVGLNSVFTLILLARALGVL